MFYDHFPQSDAEIVGSDGVRKYETKALFGSSSKGSITIPDTSLVIEPGDEIRRRLPNGIDETFQVIDSVYHDQFHAIPARFELKIRKKGTFPTGSGGNYNVRVSGANARVNIGSADHSTNIVVRGDIFGQLAGALKAGVADPVALEGLLGAVEHMKEQKGGSGFVSAYQKFVSLTADHIGIVSPFLPALSQLL